jgi:hypothetical protein
MRGILNRCACQIYFGRFAFYFQALNQSLTKSHTSLLAGNAHTTELNDTVIVIVTSVTSHNSDDRTATCKKYRFLTECLQPPKSSLSHCTRLQSY